MTDKDKILGMSDDELKEKIMQASSLLGKEKSSVKVSVSDIAKIRKALKTVSEEDIAAILERTDDPAIRGILSRFGKE